MMRAPERRLGREHSTSITAPSPLGFLPWRLGRGDEAELDLRRAVERIEQPWNPRTLDACADLGELLLLAPARRVEPILSEASELLSEPLGPAEWRERARQLATGSRR